MNTTTINRRGFMARLCAGAAIPFACPRVNAAAKAASLHRLALIGCGSRGAGCLDALGRLRAETMRIIAVCDTDASRGQYWAQHADAEYTADWRDCVASPEVDGIIVAAPDDVSRSISAHAASHGKSVFRDCSTSATPSVLLRELTGDDASLHLFSPVSALARGAATLMEDCGIGAARFGHACMGNCDRVADVHTLQIWFLIEALRPQGPWRVNTISDPTRQCMMTEIAYENGVRLEVTSTTRETASKGVCVRCDGGTLRAHEQHLTCTPTTGPGQAILIDTEHGARMEALCAWLRDDPSMRILPIMSHIGRDVARLTRRASEAGQTLDMSVNTTQT